MSIMQLNLPAWKVNTWICKCDYCGAQVKKLGLEAGDAAENARKEGFTTVSVRVESPMKWMCLTCKNKRTAGKGASNA